MTTDIHPIHNIGPQHAEQIQQLFQHTHWAQHRTLHDIRTMIRNTAVNVGLQHDNTLIAYARALSDGTYKAIIEDVVVAPQHRRHGHGHTLMSLIMQAPNVRNVEEVELYCAPELAPFYAQHGVTIIHNQHLMRLHHTL